MVDERKRTIVDETMVLLWYDKKEATKPWLPFYLP